MKYAQTVHGCKFFILDNLKALEAEFNDANKEMNKLFADLKRFAVANKVVIIIVSHVRKGSNNMESFKAGRPPTTEDLYGSSAIGAWVSVIFLLSRNVVSDDDFESRIMRVDKTKDRIMGNRGANKFHLLYYNDTGRLHELDYSEYEVNNE
jgi:hypothetical protein